MIKVLLVDDDKLVREALKGLVNNHPDFNVVDSLDSGEQALTFLEAAKTEIPVDIILLDLHMPGLSGFETTKKIHRKYPKTKIVIVTSSKADSLPKHLLNAGASSYLTKGCDVDELPIAIKRSYAGGNYISRELSQQISMKLIQYNGNPFDLLSGRELQIIILILQAVKANKIAKQLNLSEKTISTQKIRAYDKLNIENDIELVYLAIQYKIVDAN